MKERSNMKKWKHHHITLNNKYIPYVHDQHLSDVLYIPFVSPNFSVVTMSLLLFVLSFLFFFLLFITPVCRYYRTAIQF